MNDILRTQMIMSLGMVRNPLGNLVALNVFDIATKTFPVWSSWIRTTCCTRRRRLSSREPRSTIVCERGTPATQQTKHATPYQDRMDAVVHTVTTLPAVKTLLAVTHHDYLPHDFEPISLDTDVYFELMDLQVRDGQPELIKFRLCSYEHDIQHLQTFVDTCNVDYERRMKNKLGNSRYFFDQMVASKVRGAMQNPLPTTHLVYTKTKFTTNRTFDNVFFEQKRHVRTRTRFFLDQKSWYDKKGIPYTLGFLFHGSPGCGKTSTVKAIANEGRRHIINVQLSEIKTKSQLQNLFFNDQIVVWNGPNLPTETYTIPISERLYVIEDIDAMGDTVLRREWKKPQTAVSAKEEDAWLAREKEAEKETIDLSFLLNLLDGTLEANGRILIITTNYPERIDQALIRPGRVDMIVHFQKCNRAVLREMVEAFYDEPVDIPDDPALDYKWSPAEVNQILFRNFETPDEALKELITLQNGCDGVGIPEFHSDDNNDEQDSR